MMSAVERVVPRRPGLGFPGSSTPAQDPALRVYRRERMEHWDAVARRTKGERRWAAYYHRRLEEVCRFLVQPGMDVLEIGCAEGDLLAAVKPRVGIGIDISREMLRAAARRHPELVFLQADGHALPLDTTFDFVLMSDLLNDVWDVQLLLETVRKVCHRKTRVIITSYNRLWEPLLALADRLNMARPNLHQNWLTVEDINNLLYLAGFEPVRAWEEILWPLGTPLLAPVLNSFLVRFWPLNHLALTHVLVARPRPEERAGMPAASVSVVVPARNEAGNIDELFRRLPRFAAEAELIFVEGHSHDATYEALAEAIAQERQWKCQLIRQQGVGKGDAVREGFARARGDILIILDADLTVPPEDLPRFYQAVVSGKAELANGVRLVYPAPDEAMRFLNLVGNKFFSLAFSWLLGQPIKNTLCGTKALWKRDYEVIAQNRPYFGDVDPFGDFDLLLGAAKLSLKIVDVPVRYRNRTYGTTNISRWRDGFRLLRMLLKAARRLKFV